MKSQKAFLFILIISLSLIEEIESGAACYGACLGICLGLGAIAFGKKFGIPLDVTGCQTMCMVPCAAGVSWLPACYEKKKKIITFNNDKFKEKFISEIKPHDIVLTMKNKMIVKTEVINNIKTEGNFKFLEFTCLENGSNKELKKIKVTENHVMISLDNKKQVVVNADKVHLGQNFITNSGVCKVIKIDSEIKKNKYTLITEKGTVLSNGILTATMCEQNLTFAKYLKEALIKWDDTIQNLKKHLI